MSRVSAVVSIIQRRSRTLKRIRGRNVQARPSGQPTKNASIAQNANADAATSDGPSRKPIDRAKTNVKKAAKKKVIVAPNVRACGSGRISAIQFSGSYTAGWPAEIGRASCRERV